MECLMPEPMIMREVKITQQLALTNGQQSNFCTFKKLIVHSVLKVDCSLAWWSFIKLPCKSSPFVFGDVLFQAVLLASMTPSPPSWASSLTEVPSHASSAGSSFGVQHFNVTVPHTKQTFQLRMHTHRKQNKTGAMHLDVVIPFVLVRKLLATPDFYCRR